MSGLPQDISSRIWARDDALWASGDDLPSERLGWLDLPETMLAEIPHLTEFADGVVRDKYEQVVLLGMGGSSLAPEMFSRVFGSSPGFPELHMLDSTHPAQIISTGSRLDLNKALFVVSSKSGGTIETLSLYRHFRSLLDDGSHFVAITDPGSSLAALAEDTGFRDVFLNPPDIGGRFSALSLFGLVPAALLGMNLELLLERSAKAAADSTAQQSSAVRLGELLAERTKAGLDKLTMLTSPTLKFFGYWVEQLLAESTGKSGTGIIPIVDEPHHAGGHRAWARLSLDGEDPPVGGTLDYDALLADRYDLGAEIFRWEFATAVAGVGLGVNPFDQPNVEAAKVAARSALESGESVDWPDDDPGAFFQGMSEPEWGALLAFAPWTPAAWSVIESGRARLSREQRVPTVGAFGPRYLHSSGQLYKGGPDTIRALVVIDPPVDNLPIPGGNQTFDQLVTAQASGDAAALESTGKKVARTRWKTFAAWAEGST